MRRTMTLLDDDELVTAVQNSLNLETSPLY
jgi:hypothetical protein